MHKLIQASVFAAIGVLVFASLLIPVVDDATDHSAVLSNNYEATGYYVLADNSPVTFSYDGTTYKVNNETVTPYNATLSTVTSDGLVIRWSGGAPGFYANDTNIGNLSAFALTASNGVVTGSYTQYDTEYTEFEWAYTYMFYQDKTGNYVMTGGVDYPGTTYLLGDSTVYCTGYNTNLGSGTSRWFEFKGSIDDGFTFEYGGNTITDVTVNYTAVEGYTEPVYAVSSFTVDVSESVTVTINRYVAPLELNVVETSDTALDSMLGILPLVVILVLIFGVLSVAVYQRIE